jgi:kynurenine formamidase
MSDSALISRRSLLATTLGGLSVLALREKLLAAAVQEPAAAAPAAAPKLVKADIDQMMKELSNWGRWGKHDQLGTVNLITQARRKHALSLAREATVVSLAHAQSVEKSLDNERPLIRTMTLPKASQKGMGSAAESYSMYYHGYYYTHMDAFSHMFYDDQGYNGNPPGIVTADGTSQLDIAAFQNGIVTRGILMDIPRLKGLPYLEPGAVIYPEDLDAWEKKAGVKAGAGDMLLVRVGRWGRRAEKGPISSGTSPGMFATCARWLKQRDIAVLGSDAMSDAQPSLVEDVSTPIHRLAMVAMGLPILDNCDLEALSETANRLRRWEFLVTAAPMVIPGGTGSPLNPLAIF